MKNVKSDLGSGGTYTDNIIPPMDSQDPNYGYMSLSISGTWTGTVTLLRSFDGGSTWYSVDSFTSNAETTLFEPVPGAVYKAGFQSGDYGSGTVTVGIYK